MLCVITERTGQMVVLLPRNQIGVFSRKTRVQTGAIWEVASIQRLDDQQVLLRPVRRIDPPPTLGLLESLHLFASDSAIGIMIELWHWFDQTRDLWRNMRELDESLPLLVGSSSAMIAAPTW